MPGRILFSNFPIDCFISFQPFIETRTVGSDFQIIRTAGSHLQIRYFFKTLKTCVIFCSGENMESLFKW